MVVPGRCQPHSVVQCLVALIAQYEDDLVFDIDRQTAEHRAGHGRKRGKSLEHEFERDRLASFDSEECVVICRKTLIATST